MVAETERLILEKLTPDDAAFFLKLVNTPNWLKYIGDRQVYSLEDAKQYLLDGPIKSYEDKGFGFYKLLLKSADNIAIGTCGLVKREVLEDVDIGFAMLPEYEGKGFGYESSQAVIELAKKEFNINRLVAITLPINAKSIKLLEKLGLEYEKRVKPFEDDEELLLFAKIL
ncbi:GNAT family N-acetyltransferase [Gaetbulibacter saemankumensis]|uniref:GNAT family N-acetyltransferase n=1 Tax=Gaetbulibacter saemankumensis TaxID=311208 RepID=UPI000418211E|nr:GNAT family N-acetyltransferase [Gaetbulibacter saemankumensis]